MKSYVSITNDISLAAPTLHEGMLVPSLVSVEAPVPMYWPPGTITRAHRLTHKVFHKGLPLCQGNHDLGISIPHAHTPVPDPLADPLDTAKSSRKHLFSGSRVRANGQPLGACGWANHSVQTPCLACGSPISQPHVGNITFFSNSVLFGVTADDIAKGWAGLVTEMLVDAAGLLGKNTLWGWVAKHAAKDIKMLIFEAPEFFTEDGPGVLERNFSAPWIGDVVSATQGIRRDENGDYSVYARTRVGRHEVGTDWSWDWPPVKFHYEKTSEKDGGDEIVTRDGEKYRYQGGDFEDFADARENWGRVTREEEK
jgi:hypothetical protein